MLVLLGPGLVEKIRSLLIPFGLRLEEGKGALFVAGEREREVKRVASILSIALSEAAGKEKEEAVVLEDADLSEVEEELANIRRMREQEDLWRKAGLPEPSEAAWRGWWAVEEMALLVREVALSDDRFRKVLEEARILYARILAREVHST